MFIRSIDQPLVDLGEDHCDLILLLVGYGFIEDDLLI